MEKLYRLLSHRLQAVEARASELGLSGKFVVRDIVLLWLQDALAETSLVAYGGYTANSVYIELDVLWNLDRIDLDEDARRCAPKGLRRLATLLAFYRVATGRPLPTGFSYVALAETELLRRKLSELVSYVFVDGEDTEKGI